MGFKDRIQRTLVRHLQGVWSRANDLHLGIVTDANGDIDREIAGFEDRGSAHSTPRSIHNDSNIYQPADYLNIRRVLHGLALAESDVFYDIGCGKGRVVCVAARHHIHRVVGVELSRTLCHVAQTNARRLRGRRTPIEIRCEDAAVSDLSNGTIYFMYNPFQEATIRDVLGKIELSLQHRPRCVRIVYYNAMFDHILHPLTWLGEVYEFKTLTGRPVRVYSSKTSV